MLLLLKQEKPKSEDDVMIDCLNCGKMVLLKVSGMHTTATVKVVLLEKQLTTTAKYIKLMTRKMMVWQLIIMMLDVTSVSPQGKTVLNLKTPCLLYFTKVRVPLADTICFVTDTITILKPCWSRRKLQKLSDFALFCYLLLLWSK